MKRKRTVTFDPKVGAPTVSATSQHNHPQTVGPLIGNLTLEVIKDLPIDKLGLVCQFHTELIKREHATTQLRIEEEQTVREKEKTIQKTEEEITKRMREEEITKRMTEEEITKRLAIQHPYPRGNPRPPKRHHPAIPSLEDCTLRSFSGAVWHARPDATKQDGQCTIERVYADVKEWVGVKRNIATTNRRKKTTPIFGVRTDHRFPNVSIVYILDAQQRRKQGEWVMKFWSSLVPTAEEATVDEVAVPEDIREPVPMPPAEGGYIDDRTGDLDVDRLFEDLINDTYNKKEPEATTVSARRNLPPSAAAFRWNSADLPITPTCS